VTPESKLYQDLKKETCSIVWNRIENLSIVGMPDVLGYNKNHKFFTVELKVIKGNKIKFSPDTKHWLPTREAKLLQYMDPEVIPKNLLIRLSATKVNGAAPTSWPWTSTVTDGKDKTCPASDQGGKCRSCRKCWTHNTNNTAYAQH